MLSKGSTKNAAALACGLILSTSASAFAQTYDFEYSFNWLDYYDPDNISYGGNINGHDWSVVSSSGESTEQWVVDGTTIYSGYSSSATTADWQRLYDALGINGASSESTVEESASVNNHISTRTVVSNIANRASSLARAARESQTAQAPGGSEPLTTGLSGGDVGEWALGRLGVWADGSVAVFSDWNSRDGFQGNQMSFMGGADYRFTDRFMTGAGLGFERARIEFDGGSERAVTYANMTAYGAYLIDDAFSLNALGSYGLGFNAMQEPVGSSDDYVSHRFVTAANVAYSNVFDRVTTFGYAGLSYSHETFGSYKTVSGQTAQPDDVQLLQMYGLGDVGYTFQVDDGTMTPFLSARLEYDAVRSGKNDRFGSVLGGGVRAQWTDSLSLEAFGNTEVARSNEMATSFGLNMRVQF